MLIYYTKYKMSLSYNKGLNNFIELEMSDDNSNCVCFPDIENVLTPKDNRYNTRKRKAEPAKSTKQNDKKKSRSDDELIRMLVNGRDDSSSEDEANQAEPECNNPLCDHKDFTNEEKARESKSKVIEKPREITSIDDLIELGKKYHCKKNRVYYGINLRLLCNLVEPLTKLKNMIGMKNVKENMVNQIVFFLQGFNQKEACQECVDCVYGLPCTKNMNDDMLHTIITGPPGVGKTEVGKILAHVYKAMGVLSKGHMHVATRSDLIGKYLGHTAVKTQEFINKCKGGVMFIDEAYSLGHSEGRDSFSKECLDTINQNLSENRDLLVIIAGYADALDKCFFSFNDGLKRRFTFRYDIKGYSAEELMEIFLYKVKKEGWGFEFDVQEGDSGVVREKERKRMKVRDFFIKNKNSFKCFGGDVETFILNCKVIHATRVLFLDKSYKKALTVSDIEKGLVVFKTHRKSKDKKDSDDDTMDIRTIYSN